MATNYVAEGANWNYTPGSAVASGAVVLMGVTLGVALAAIAANTTGAVAVDGVFTVAKLSTDVVAQGAKLYWDAANSRLTTTASGNTYAGRAYEAAGSGATTVRIRINFGS